MSKWISVKDGYPADGSSVLILIPVTNRSNVESATYDGDGDFTGAWFGGRGKSHCYKVTHWMPLPEPPANP